MFENFWHNLSPKTRANIVLLSGVLLFMNTMNLVKGLNYLITIIALFMIGYGFVTAGYWNWILTKIKKA
jgi:hypothetical protein